MIERVEAAVRVDGGQHAEREADQHRDGQRDQRQPQRVREGVGDQRRRPAGWLTCERPRLSRATSVSQISVADRQRLVQPEPLPLDGDSSGVACVPSIIRTGSPGESVMMAKIRTDASNSVGTSNSERRRRYRCTYEPDHG